MSRADGGGLCQDGILSTAYVTPMEFFDLGNRQPEFLSALIGNLKKLDARALDAVSGVVDELVRRNG